MLVLVTLHRRKEFSVELTRVVHTCMDIIKKKKTITEKPCAKYPTTFSHQTLVSREESWSFWFSDSKSQTEPMVAINIKS